MKKAMAIGFLGLALICAGCGDGWSTGGTATVNNYDTDHTTIQTNPTTTPTAESTEEAEE